MPRFDTRSAAEQSADMPNLSDLLCFLRVVRWMCCFESSIHDRVPVWDDV